MDDKAISAEVSIVVPCFNEISKIESTVSQITDYMERNFAEKAYELIVVNDGSDDGTGDSLEQLKVKYKNLKVHHFSFNRGRGAAIKKGVGISVGQYVVLLDADLTYDVDHIGDILRRFSEDPQVDVVVVSPYMNGGIVKNVPLKRLFLSKVANWILAGSISNRISTVTCVVRGYNGNKIRNLPLLEEGKELHLEILRKFGIMGAKVVEIPGRLVWKSEKIEKRRKNNLRVAVAAKDHMFYALLSKPTNIFQYLSFFLILVGIYEMAAIFYNVWIYFPEGQPSFIRSLWVGMSKSFEVSPHTFFISGLSLILGFQSLCFLALFQVMKLQQEEVLKHLLTLNPKLKDKFE